MTTIFFLARLVDHEETLKYTNGSGGALGCMNNADFDKN
jgi:hypothetical protein